MNQVDLIRKALIQKNRITLPLTGSSMEPTLKEGDIATIIPIECLGIGDVILFEACGKLVIHRVTEISDNWVVTKGDNHDFCDDVINKNRIIGKLYNDENIKQEKNDLLITKNRKITFNKHGFLCDSRFLEVYNIESIDLIDESIIDKSVINIGVTSMANSMLSSILPIFNNKQKCIFHFNIKVSNKERDSYYKINEFDYLIRVCEHISSSLLTVDEQMLITSATLKNIGVYNG